MFYTMTATLKDDHSRIIKEKLSVIALMFECVIDENVYLPRYNLYDPRLIADWSARGKAFAFDVKARDAELETLAFNALPLNPNDLPADLDIAKTEPRVQQTGDLISITIGLTGEKDNGRKILNEFVELIKAVGPLDRLSVTIGSTCESWTEATRRTRQITASNDAQVVIAQTECDAKLTLN